MTSHRGSGWTSGLLPVVFVMLSGVVGACVAMFAVVCVTGAPMCVVLYHRHVFFACGGILGHSDVLIGPPVFLLGGEKSYFALRPILMGTKNLYENGPNPFFFCFFSILWEREWSRFV